MTPAETVLLVRYIAGCCPHQKIDSYTPDAWHDLLGDLDLDACKSAAAEIARTRPFVAASDIRTLVDRKSTAGLPHSDACRGRNCRDCLWSWCRCLCHRRAVVHDDGPLAIEAS
jgi:hypothetical protein